MLLKYEGGQYDGREMDVADGVDEQILPHPAGRLGKTGGDRYRREKRKGRPDAMGSWRSSPESKWAPGEMPTPMTD